MAFDSSREVSIRTIVLPWKKKARFHQDTP